MIENKRNNEKVKEKRKGSRIIFGFTLVSILFQTILTFTLLLKSTEENARLSKITGVLFAVYLISFAILTISSVRTRKYGKEGLNLYKASMKWFKRIVKLLLVVISILNIFSAVKVDILALMWAIILLVVNVFLIALDFFVSGVKFVIGRRVKKWKKNRQEKLNKDSNGESFV